MLGALKSLDLRYSGALARKYKKEAGFTALHMASENSSVSVIPVLVEAGADLNAKTDKGLTALHIACKQGNGKCAQAIIDAGYDLTDDVTTYLQHPFVQYALTDNKSRRFCAELAFEEMDFTSNRELLNDLLDFLFLPA